MLTALSQPAGCRRSRAATASLQPTASRPRSWLSAAAIPGPRGDTPADEYQKKLEQASVINSLDSLMTFPRLAQLIEKGKIATHGAYFGVATGDLSVLDAASGEFKPIERK